MKVNPNKHDGTKPKLIETGRDVFAQHGFRSETAGEIFSRAAAHMNAANYHIPDKEGRYSDVLDYSYHLAVHSLRESEKRYRLLFQSAPIALIERDASELKIHLDRLRKSGISNFSEYFTQNPEEVERCFSLIKTVDCNDSLLDLVEASRFEVLSAGYRRIIQPHEVGELAREVILLVAEGAVSHEVERVFTISGKKKHLLIKALAVSGHEDTLSRITIAFIDITERKQVEEGLRQREQQFRDQAMRDDLTGLYNRRYLYNSLEAWIAECRTSGSRVSAVFMDLDHFKNIVDTHGHLNGSEAIREVAATIREALESPAYAVAFAGDEFVIILPGCTEVQATRQVKDIQERMGHTVYLRSQGLEISLQASFGIATFPDHASDMYSLLAASDKALFAVKQNGRNGVRHAKNK